MAKYGTFVYGGVTKYGADDPVTSSDGLIYETKYNSSIETTGATAIISEDSYTGDIDSG